MLVTPAPHLRHRCVVFDLDGTLLDTRPALIEVLNLQLQEMGRARVDASRLQHAMHLGLGAMLHDALDDTGPLPPANQLHDMTDALRHRYWRAAPRRVRPFPGTVALLDALQAAGMWLAVCSNQDEASVRVLLDMFGLRRYFREVLGGDSFVARKPDPMPLRWLMTCAHCSPEATVMVGDSALDAECAQRAGAAAVLMAHGYGGDGIRVPHTRLDDFTALRAWLLEAS